MIDFQNLSTLELSVIIRWLRNSPVFQDVWGNVRRGGGRKFAAEVPFAF
jgi:hypothetical protein